MCKEQFRKTSIGVLSLYVAVFIISGNTLNEEIQWGKYWYTSHENKN